MLSGNFTAGVGKGSDWQSALMTAQPFEVVYEPAEVLHKPAALVEVINGEIRDIAIRMWRTMYERHGIGLAAPQVGISLQILVIDIDQKYNFLAKQQRSADRRNEDMHEGEPIFMFNPKVLEQAKEMSEMKEGCLSAPGVGVMVKRPAAVKVAYLDFHGVERVLDLGPDSAATWSRDAAHVYQAGLVSTCFQHEYDHVNGVTILNYLSDRERMLELKRLEKRLKNQR